MQNQKTEAAPNLKMRRRTDIASNFSEEISKKGEAVFFSIFAEILVDNPAPIEFSGSICKAHMKVLWLWLIRDIAPELSQMISDASDEKALKQALISHCPTLAEKVSDMISKSSASQEVNHRLLSQLNGEEIKNRLPTLYNALRCQSLIDKAGAFGHAANSIEDDASLGAALQSMSLQDPAIASLLFHAIVGQSQNPSRLIVSIAHNLGAASEAAFLRAGFLPLLEALLSHSQNQVALISGQQGIYVDADLMCKTIYRFNKLMRALTNYVELERYSYLCKTSSEITNQMARLVEPRLREVSADVSQSLRKPRDGKDRVDQDLLLSALNGIYILAAVRQAKESLALNALFEKVWIETKQILETLIDRNLEDYKKDISNKNTSQRLDMGIKMAEIRFGTDYAKILQQAKDKISKRITDAA